jgi:hypothetical protein
MRQLLIVIVALCLPCAARAQATGFSDLGQRLAQVVATVDSQFDCTIQTHGEPRMDESSRQWLAAFSAAGADCDPAIDALRGEGAALGIVLFRRPTPDQLREIVAEMIRSVESTSACRITVRRDPQLQDITSRWFVSYRAAGEGCEEADEELRRQGRVYDIEFIRMPEIGLIR